MKVQPILIDPRKLKLLEVNAHYMRYETFTRLVKNVEKDKALTSTPFCAPWRYYTEADEITRDEAGEIVYEVLSGNHRVKSAVEAGLMEIYVLATDEPLTVSQRRAIQLSHNELVGEDDAATLRVLYQEIDDVTWRLYSGLDDRKLDLLDDIKPGALSEANLTFQMIGVAFLPDDLKLVDAALEAAKKEAGSTKQVWLNAWSSYDRYMDALEAASQAHGVRNTATAMMIVLEVFSRHMEDLADGYLDKEGNLRPGNGRGAVPIASVMGSAVVPAKTAAALSKIVRTMMSQGKIKKGNKWEVLDKLIAAYEKQPDNGRSKQEGKA